MPVLLLLFTPVTVFADAGWFMGIPEWYEPESLDVGAIELPSAPGDAGFYVDGTGAGSVVYAKDGDIWLVRFEAGVWSEPIRLTDDPAESRDPKLSLHNGILHVVWEDSRTGHPEVWTRNWNGVAWSPEVCLTEDEVISWRPSMSGSLLVWQEGEDGVASVQARSYAAGWGSVEVVSDSPAAAFQPSVVSADEVVWVDTRHGGAEIHFTYRTYGGWASSIRLTDLPGDCAAPVGVKAWRGGDAAERVYKVVFEHTTGGVTEVWSICRFGGSSPQVAPASAIDGVSSVAPDVAGLTTSDAYLLFGNSYDNFYPTWTDLSPAQTHYDDHVACGDAGSPTPMATGTSHSILSASLGRPYGGLLALWTEPAPEGVVLKARRGWTFDCADLRFETPRASILIAPEGEPANTFVVTNLCAYPEPILLERWPVALEFTAPLDAQLTWDPEQAHPLTPPVRTDENGVASISVRGGGCSPSGYVLTSAYTPWEYVPVFVGARSPDVDGDCIVEPEDLQYIADRFGTADFCADLDGSGLVDSADLALAVPTLYDRCSHVVGVEEGDPYEPGIGGDPGGGEPGRGGSDPAVPGAPVHAPGTALTVRVTPNPITSSAALHLVVPERGRILLQVFDVGGRLVRTLHSGTLSEGAHAFRWDLDGRSGAEVSSGVYLAVARTARESVTRTLLVVR